MIKVKRVYLPPEGDDGFRILVDRLWPRGLKKESATMDLWMKDVAPSSQLRKWFGHDPKKWKGFKERYRKELDAKPELVAELRRLRRTHRVITLLFASREEQFNQAVALKEILS